MSDKTRTLLFWIDFEATGLDIRKGVGELLEYAVVVTDLQLNELVSKEGVIPQDMTWIEDILEPKAREMHEANGLLKDLYRVSKDKTIDDMGPYAYEKIELSLRAMLQRFLDEDPKTIFVTAGSSVSYDRGALKERMPKLERMLHYRQLDVSVYKVGFPKIFGSETSPAHRAMADIRESIKKHQLMRDILGKAGLANFI